MTAIAGAQAPAELSAEKIETNLQKGEASCKKEKSDTLNLSVWAIRPLCAFAQHFIAAASTSH